MQVKLRFWKFEKPLLLSKLSSHAGKTSFLDLKFKSANDASTPIIHHPSPRPPPILQSHLTLPHTKRSHARTLQVQALPVIRQRPIRENPAPPLPQTPTPFLQSHLTLCLYNVHRLKSASRHPPASAPGPTWPHPPPNPLLFKKNNWQTQRPSL